MRTTGIKSCYVGPAISPENFIAEHTFLYLTTGLIEGYDGMNRHTLHPGEYCLVRKNHLVRYSKQRDGRQFEKTVVVFDRNFLRSFQEKHKPEQSATVPEGAFMRLKPDNLVPNLINSLLAYYNQNGQMDEPFSSLKREELLLILLRLNPGLSAVLFDFGAPGKIDLEAFMKRNYTFNAGISRFAYLSGRSLSTFKRDFKAIFHNTPQRWLTDKRLEYAYNLIVREKRMPSEVFLESGFENLSHFSYAFKKRFGQNPSALAAG